MKINHYLMSRFRGRGVRLLALTVLCTSGAVVVSDTGVGVVPETTSLVSVEVNDALILLKRAGASTFELASFENDAAQRWPEDRERLEESLTQLSEVELVHYVESLRQSFSPDNQYVLGPDYAPQVGVPRGKVLEFTLNHSAIFPGTTRKIRVYVPAQYNGLMPACVYVSLDDLFFPAPRALDNLIFHHEIPVMIAIGLRPGIVGSTDPPHDPRFDRSAEFDALNDHLARFLLEEVFPRVEGLRTSGGLPIRLSKDPNDRAVGGLSTGGIGAFTLAWERPDAFRRVFTGIGTFVGMRGGDRYPVLVRKTEPKPIRIFMQDGSNDELTDDLGEVGDWWMGNQSMQRALEFAGYQVAHVWGEGSHNPKHAMAIFPDVMRWLWKDWPEPVKAGESHNTFLNDILLPGEGWRVVGGSYRSARALASDHEGAVTFWDEMNGEAWRISGSEVAVVSVPSRTPYFGMAYGPDDRAYVTEADDERVVAYAPDGRSLTVAKGIAGSNLVVANSGAVYVTEPGDPGGQTGKVWLIKPDGARVLLDQGLSSPSGIALSPDGLWLAVAENRTHWGYSYRVRSDGSVDDKKRFYWFHVPDEADNSGAGPWVMDREGRLYAATRMGVQVFDRNGRVRAILPLPGGEATGLTFGGTNLDILYVSCSNHKVYRRAVKSLGERPSGSPVRLPPGAPG